MPDKPDRADTNTTAWWAISSDVIMDALNEVKAGAEPGDVYDKLYMESQHEWVEGEE